MRRRDRTCWRRALSTVGIVSVFSLCGCHEATERVLPGHRSSVLLLSADSLRVDRLALFNDGTGVPTPELARLAGQGTLFTNAWASTPWTAPSMVSVLSGLYPPSHGVVQRDDTTPVDLPTLPRLLERQGYELGNFSFFSDLSYFRNLGLGPPAAGLRHGREAQVFSEWIDGLGQDEPFFAWIHLLHPHLPYGSSGYRAREIQVAGSTGLERAQLEATVPLGSVEFGEGDRDKLIELYDADLVGLDQEIGRILVPLRESGRLERTIVVFVADHGEELLDDGWVGHASTSIEAKLLPEILHVPLLLVGPQVPQGEQRADLVRQVDLMPTILALLGVEAPTSDGVDLLSPRPTSWWSRLFGRPRPRLAFFDSSAGGNLTPIERRGERLQGLTDGDCLLSLHTFPGRDEILQTRSVRGEGCREGSTETLRQALDAVRQAQLSQRASILEGGESTEAVVPRDVESFAETLDVVEPAVGVLEFEASSGQIRLAWAARQGEPPLPDFASYVVQYEAGGGFFDVEGSFRIDQAGIDFGPFPEGFWNDVAGYSPFRFRVVEPKTKRRSGWYGFSVAKVP